MSQYAADLCVHLVEHTYGELSSVSALHPLVRNYPTNPTRVGEIPNQCKMNHAEEEEADFEKRTLGVLFLYGRLSFNSLLYHTGFTNSQLRHSLAVLVQEHFVFWYTSAEEGLTSYEADLLGCYSLVRSGKCVRVAEERFGNLAGTLVNHILQLGHGRVGDLVQAWKGFKTQVPNGALNGHSDDHQPAFCNGSSSKISGTQTTHIPASVASIHGTLSDLLSSGLLSIINEFHFYTDADKRTEAEKRAKQRSKIEGKMKKEEAEAYERGIAAQLLAWKYGTEGEREEIVNLKGGRKRLLENGVSDKDGKRPRLASDSKISNEGYLNEDLVLRVNHEKFMVLERNSRLAELVSSSIGPITSRIYMKVLQILEADVQQCKEAPKLPGIIVDVDDKPNPRSLPQLRTDDLRHIFTDLPEMADAIGHVDKSKINMAQYDHPKKRRRKGAPILSGDIAMVEVEGQVSSDESEDAEEDEGNVSGVESDPDGPNEWDEEEAFDPNNSNSRKRKRSTSPKGFVSPLRQHLFLLSNQSCHLLHHLPAIWSVRESWSVDFQGLSHHLLTNSIFHTISNRFGPLATRLVRILHQRGKLDEKTLTSLGLINQKNMRAILTSMNRAGFLELQEIPKGNDRQPSKTIYLWFFDEERCRQRLLDETYKAMTRVLQRIGVEREKVKGTVEKSERVDVEGREEEILSEHEQKALKEWRAKEERLLGELGKLDDLVAILRDF